MRLTSVIGVVLIVLGVVELTARGIRYAKDWHATGLGPVEVSTARSGFLPPFAGAIAIVTGLALLGLGRRTVK